MRHMRLADHRFVAAARALLRQLPGCPIPFTRGSTQILKTLYLSPSATPGGFLPAGANGVRA